MHHSLQARYSFILLHTICQVQLLQEQGGTQGNATQTHSEELGL